MQRHEYEHFTSLLNHSAVNLGACLRYVNDERLEELTAIRNRLLVIKNEARARLSDRVKAELDGMNPNRTNSRGAFGATYTGD
jgi:hypothetical protein